MSVQKAKMLDTNGSKSSFRGIRSSKFKHVYGDPAKKNKCYDNIKITRNTGDFSFCAVNPKFLAVVVEVGGGGSFLVLPLGEEKFFSYSQVPIRRAVPIKQVG